MNNILVICTNVFGYNGIAGVILNYYKVLDKKKMHIDMILINEPSEENTPKYDMRYIYKRNGFYYILKSINGEYKYFKGSTSLKEAVEFRDKLIENNWRDNGELKIEELEDNRYIYSVGNSFQLKKYIKGKTKHFGTFKTLEEAIKARNELIMNNWGMLE